MKILFLSSPNQDYLNDTLFHGFRSLFGPEVVDIDRVKGMYKNDFKDYPWYTFYGLLPDIEVDREDIPRKIATHYFDLVIYGSVHRNRKYLSEVTSAYSSDRVIFIDGEDADGLIAFDHIEPQNLHPWEPKGYALHPTKLYFKRELYESHRDMAIPIQFSIPKEKIISLADIPPKTRLMAPMSPTDGSTHIYGLDEQDKYFRQYSESFFGRTTKKGGWDCARHYEIMAAGAIPYFERLEECPRGTLALMPKKEFFEARALCDSCNGDIDKLDIKLYVGLLVNTRKVLLDRLTTEAMAKYVLGATE
jgi:hypothetical protein